jgi:hypothetical protein
MFVYSGYIDCGLEEASYEFESEVKLDAVEQLQYLLDTGILQIVPNPPQEV